MKIGDKIILLKDAAPYEVGELLDVKAISRESGSGLLKNIFVAKPYQENCESIPLDSREEGSVWERHSDKKIDEQSYFLVYTDENANMLVEKYSSVEEAKKALSGIEVNDQSEVFLLVKGEEISVKKKFVIE